MRVIFNTGKGGVGKTTISAATAVRASKLGYRTLVMSTDPAHSLSDSMGVTLSPYPTEVTKNLWAQEINVLEEIKVHWGELQKYMSTLLLTKGFDSIVSDELAVAPGMEELSSLFQLNYHYHSNKYDLILIDCAPTGEAVRLLTLPDVADWYIGKLSTVTRTAMNLIRPLVRNSVMLPDDNVFGAVEGLIKEISQVKEIINNKDMTSIRIILNPEKMVLKESQRAFTYFNLFGYNVDLIICNRVFPDNVSDKHFDNWVSLQKKYMGEIDSSFSPLPIFNVKMLNTEVVGLELLDLIGQEIFGDKDPTQIFFKEQLQKITKDKDDYILSIYLPLVEKKKFSLKKKNDDLFIEIGNLRKNIILPRTLSNLEPIGASFEGKNFNIRFSKV